MAGDAIVGALRVVLGMDTASYEDGAKRAAEVTQSFGKQMLAVAGGIQIQKFIESVTDSLKDFVKDAVATGDALQKMAQRTGVPVSELSGLAVAAQVSDLSVEQLARGIKNLQVELIKAGSNAITPAASAIKFLGLNLKEVSKASPQEAILQISEAFTKVEDPASRAAVVAALFGKKFGSDLIPLLQQGRDGINKTIEVARSLGLVVSDEFGVQAEKFSDSLKILGLVTKGIALQALAPFIASMAESKQKMIDYIVQINLVGKASEGLIRTIIFLKDNMTALSIAIGVLVARFVVSTVVSFSAAILTLVGRLALLAATNLLVAASWAIWASGIAVVLGGILLLTGQLDPFLKKVEEITAKMSLGVVSQATLDGLKQAGLNTDAFTKALKELGIVQDDQDKKRIEIPGKKFDPEAAKRAQEFSNELLKLNVQARELSGEFNDRLAPGFIQAAIATKVVKEDMSNLEQVLTLNNEKARLLNEALLIVNNNKLTQEFQTPWMAYEEQLKRINLQLEKGKLNHDTFQQAGIKAATTVGIAYGQAASTIAGGFADAFKYIAEKNKQYAPIAKALAIATAIANTFVAANKAMAETPGGPVLQIAAAAAVTAAGLANVAKIAATDFQTGGSFKVGGSGGIDSKMVAFNATPGEMVDVRRPGTTGGGVVEVNLPPLSSRDFFSGDMMKELVRVLNDAYSDGYKLKFAE